MTAVTSGRPMHLCRHQRPRNDRWLRRPGPNVRWRRSPGGNRPGFPPRRSRFSQRWPGMTLGPMTPGPRRATSGWTVGSGPWSVPNPDGRRWSRRPPVVDLCPGRVAAAT